MNDYIAGFMAGSMYFDPQRTYDDLPDLSSYCLETKWVRPRRIDIPKKYGIWIKDIDTGFNLFTFNNLTFIDGLKDVCLQYNTEPKYIVTDSVYDQNLNTILIQDGDNPNLLEYRTLTYINIFNDETDEIVNEMYDENILEPYRNSDL
jgi:hypothetical protein